MTIPDSFARLLADRDVQRRWLRSIGFDKEEAEFEIECARRPDDREPDDDRPRVECEDPAEVKLQVEELADRLLGDGEMRRNPLMLELVQRAYELGARVR